MEIRLVRALQKRAARISDGTGRPVRRFLEEETAGRRRLGYTLLALHVAFAGTYLSWLSQQLRWNLWYVSVPFFIAEIWAFAATTTFALTIRRPRYHRPDGIELPGDCPALDVFISTAGEPAHILEPTVAAAAALDYADKRVYLLDDAGAEAAKEIAVRYGCTYLARPTHEDAKAGNLNHALRRTSGELILALDADQVPDRDLVSTVVGYFRIPSVAFVQTAQRFRLPAGDPFGNADSLFYHVMQNSKDSDNAAFSCGSGVVYRRSALEQIGGFSTWNLVEDVHTSMRLHAAGWRSVYHHYPLSIGTAPADILGYIKQRRQWAADSLRLFFWDNPMRYRGLSLSQQLQYFYTGLGYIVAAVVLPFYFIVPIWSMLSGQALTLSPATTYAVYRGIYAACTFGAVGTLQRPTRGLKGYRLWAGAFPIFFAALLIALRSRESKPPYRVTPKVPVVLPMRMRLAAVRAQLAVLFGLTVSVPIGWVRHVLPTDALVVNTLWSLWVMWTLSTIVRAALHEEREPEPVGEYALA